MNDLKLNVTTRELLGKKVKKLRTGNLIPASMFGKDFPAVNLTVDYKEFVKVYDHAGQSAIVRVHLDNGKTENTIIKEVQIDALTQKPIHVGFHRVNMKEEIVANIPVILLGEENSMAIKEGNVLVQSLSQIEVKCLPTDLPQHIEIDISTLLTGDTITVGDVKLPKGVELVHAEEDKEIVIASISEPTKEEVPEVEAVIADPATDAKPDGEEKKEEKK